MSSLWSKRTSQRPAAVARFGKAVGRHRGPGTSDLRLVRVPSMDWPEGSKRPVYPVRNGYPRIVSASRGGEYAPRKNQVETEPLGFIPQVSHTYAYWDQDYGLMNEHQLAVAESTWSAGERGGGGWRRLRRR